MARNYLDASVWATDEIEKFVVDGRLDFPETTFAQIVLQSAAGVTSCSTSIGLGAKYFEVSLELGNSLSTIARLDYNFYDACMVLCAVNAFAGKPLPRGLQSLGAGVLSGAIKRPTPKHRERTSNFLERLFIHNTLVQASQAYGLTISRNEASDRNSACDAVSSALETCGVPMKYNAVSNLMNHPNHERLRREIEALNAIWSKCRDKGDLPVIRGIFVYLDAELSKKYEERSKLDDETVNEILSTLTNEQQKSAALVSRPAK